MERQKSSYFLLNKESNGIAFAKKRRVMETWRVKVYLLWRVKGATCGREKIVRGD